MDAIPIKADLFNIWREELFMNNMDVIRIKKTAREFLTARQVGD
jgi:hypothetical protein